MSKSSEVMHLRMPCGTQGRARDLIPHYEANDDNDARLREPTVADVLRAALLYGLSAMESARDEAPGRGGSR